MEFGVTLIGPAGLHKMATLLQSFTAWDDEKIVVNKQADHGAIVFCSLKVEPFHREVRSTGFPK